MAILSIQNMRKSCVFMILYMFELLCNLAGIVFVYVCLCGNWICRCFGVRQEAAVGYGALCAVICSILIASNGRQNHVMLGSLVDRFIGWALPLFNNISAGDGTTELALDGLREFLNVGDVGAIERYALPILKACQVLLEDERTSLSLLHRLLGVLTLISLKFSRYFQPHFLDIVDLLLGWALVPDLAESDRRIIMDSFLQFQNHWVGNLQFSLGLLSKFVGDMDVAVFPLDHMEPHNSSGGCLPYYHAFQQYCSPLPLGCWK